MKVIIIHTFRLESVLVMAPAVQWHPQGLDCVVTRCCDLIFLQRCAVWHGLGVLNPQRTSASPQTQQKKQSKKVLINKQKMSIFPQRPKGPLSKVKGAYSCSLSCDRSSSIWTKARFHTSCNIFCPWEGCLGLKMVKEACCVV